MSNQQATPAAPKPVPAALDPDGDGKMGGAVRPGPSTFYGPKGAERVFQPEDEIPKGWEDHPRKVADFVDPLEPVKLDL